MRWQRDVKSDPLGPTDGDKAGPLSSQRFHSVRLKPVAEAADR
jgi:hypothetical protein